MNQDDAQLKKLIEFANGDTNLAQEIQEDFVHLGIAILAALTYVPLNVTNKTQIQKLKVSKFIAGKLIEPYNLGFTENWLLFLKHPNSCINVLKAVYSLCTASPQMCLFISKKSSIMNLRQLILDIIS